MAQLHEYQAKRILAEQGIAVPRGDVVFDAASAKTVAGRLGGEVVVKAQVHSTSRAAAGGIKFASGAEQAGEIAAQMIGMEIAGNFCESVLIDEKAEIEKEYYLGFIIDDSLKRPCLLFSGSGGSGIEERAGSMKKLVCSIRKEPEIEKVKGICPDPEIAELLLKLYRSARGSDARVAEINPLARLKDGRLVALDARVSIDDYAVYRHPELGIDIARELGHAPTKLERIAWEIEKDDFRGTFFFVEIPRKPEAENGIWIGFNGAGGGGSMASLDAAQRNGLQPVCYVDTSGNPPASKVYRAAKIILSMPDIKGFFLSGSGVASQEQFGLARAVLKAFLEVRLNIPAVLRLGGNGEDIAKELVEKYAPMLPAPIEAYQKRHSADFCASRLRVLIEENGQWAVSNGQGADENAGFSESYSFHSKTGKISFDYSKLNAGSASKIIASCPQKILKADDNGMPVLAIDREEAERGKCSECLACEFAGMDLGINAVRIDFPIEVL